MAEAIARSQGHDATSAGTHPGEEVNANAMRVLTEEGIDCSGLYPKSLDDIDTTGHDKIISMGCGVQCPNIPIDNDWGWKILLESQLNSTDLLCRESQI